MSFRDSWVEQDNSMGADAEVVNQIANAVIQNEKDIDSAKKNIPTKISQLENDAGYITNADIPKKLSEFENDKVFITDEALPKKVSELDNDSGYLSFDDSGNIVVPNDGGLTTTDGSACVFFETEPIEDTGLSTGYMFIRSDVVDFESYCIQITNNTYDPSANDKKAAIVFSDGKGEIFGCEKVKGLIEPVEADEAANKQYVDSLIGDINSVLDELHSYAQAKINGGEA
jgi:hypothetical protein